MLIDEKNHGKLWVNNEKGGIDHAFLRHQK